MVTFELRPQVGVEVFVACLPDGAHRDLLAEDVRRFEQEAADTRQGPRASTRAAGRWNRRRCADENGLPERPPRREGPEGRRILVVHVGEAVAKGDGIGAAVSGAAVDECAAPRLAGERIGKSRHVAAHPIPSCRKTSVGARSGPGPCHVNSMRRPPRAMSPIDPPPLVVWRVAVHMFYNTIDRKIISNALADRKGGSLGRFQPLLRCGFSDLHGKVGPRIPMEAVGVSKRAFSGAILPMRPEKVRHGPLGDTNEQADTFPRRERRESPGGRVCWTVRARGRNCPGG